MNKVVIGYKSLIILILDLIRISIYILDWSLFLLKVWKLRIGMMWSWVTVKCVCMSIIIGKNMHIIIVSVVARHSIIIVTLRKVACSVWVRDKIWRSLSVLTKILIILLMVILLYDNWSPRLPSVIQRSNVTSLLLLIVHIKVLIHHQDWFKLGRNFSPIDSNLSYIVPCIVQNEYLCLLKINRFV